MRLVNVGCGRIYHSAWINYDIAPVDPNVSKMDARGGIPESSGACDAVYHSHVLEHLSQAAGGNLIKECARILRSGGIIRVAVPDLENIARQYLSTIDSLHESGMKADEKCIANHEWMTIELIDQMCRSLPGGEMAKYWARKDLPNQDFVLSRMGWQYSSYLQNEERAGSSSIFSRNTVSGLAGKFLDRFRTRLACLSTFLIAGGRAERSFRTGLFMSSGERHLWMYDRISLANLLEKSGFCSPVIQSFNTSSIPDFASYELDAWQGNIRKPDSLIMEATKK